MFIACQAVAFLCRSEASEPGGSLAARSWPVRVAAPLLASASQCLPLVLCSTTETPHGREARLGYRNPADWQRVPGSVEGCQSTVASRVRRAAQGTPKEETAWSPWSLPSRAQPSSLPPPLATRVSHSCSCVVVANRNLVISGPRRRCSSTWHDGRAPGTCEHPTPL